MEVSIPEVDALRQEVHFLTSAFNLYVANSTKAKKTITPSEIAYLEGVSLSQVRKGGKERYLLPRFGNSGYPTGCVRWDVEEYLAWRKQDPVERRQAYLQSLREEARRQQGGRA
jgi:hypothetical protein